MKNTICAAFGVVGGYIASLFGGWNASLTTLAIFMVIDYISGLVVAGVFHKSTKTPSGALESNACWKGLAKKCMILVFVLAGYRLDVALGTVFCKDGVCITFIVSELLSITENAGLMGVPLPGVITNAIELLTQKQADKAG